MRQTVLLAAMSLTCALVVCAQEHKIDTQKSTFEKRETATTQLSGTERILEDADNNLWLATRVSGLVRIDRNRRSAVRYRHSPLDPDSISEDFSKTVFEDREGNISGWEWGLLG